MDSYIGFPQDSSPTCICLSRETGDGVKAMGVEKEVCAKTLSFPFHKKAAFKRKGLHTSVAVAAAASNARRRKKSVPFVKGFEKRARWILYAPFGPFPEKGREPFFSLLHLNLKNDAVVFVEGGWGLESFW